MMMKVHIKMQKCILISFILLLACFKYSYGWNWKQWAISKCGDGICQKWEHKRGSCQKDCKILDNNSAVQTADCKVKNIVRIAEGSFPRFSPDGKKIAYTKEIKNPKDPLGIGYEIYLSDLDGKNGKCLTCNKNELKNEAWRGQPYWHPNGEYIVFTAESTKHRRKGNGTSARPGIGRNHNVWIMTKDGTKFWRITDYAENWGVIRPSFSHDGKIIYWNEEYQMEKYPDGKGGLDKQAGCYWGNGNRIFRKGEELCSWRNKIGNIAFENGEPRVSDIRHIDPPGGFTMIEGEGFSQDDKKFIYSYCNIKKQEGSCFWGEIYTTDLEGKNLKLLTGGYRIHNENAEYSPDGNKIIWNRSKGNPGEGEDLWLMNADGSEKTQLTHFFDLGYPEYNKDSKQIPESSWSPDGKSFIFGHVNRGEDQGLGPHVPSDLYLLTFEGNCGNQ